jgi:hypothetical protein
VFDSTVQMHNAERAVIRDFRDLACSNQPKSKSLFWRLWVSKVEILSMISTIRHRSEDFDTISFNDLLQLATAKVSDLDEAIVER